MRGRHTFTHRNGVVRVRVEAPSLGVLFAEAGRAVAEIIADGDPPPPKGEYEVIEVRAPDRDTLLVDFLNRVVDFSQDDRILFDRFQIELVNDRELVAGARGRFVTRLPRRLLNQDYARPHIEETADGYATTLEVRR